MKRAERVHLGVRPRVVDGGARDQSGRTIARPAIDVDDRRSFPGEKRQDASLNRFGDRPDRFGVVVRGHAHQDVDLTDIDELAKKIVRENTFFRYFDLCHETSFPTPR